MCSRWVYSLIRAWLESSHVARSDRDRQGRCTRTPTGTTNSLSNHAENMIRQHVRQSKTHVGRAQLLRCWLKTWSVRYGPWHGSGCATTSTGSRVRFYIPSATTTSEYRRTCIHSPLSTNETDVRLERSWVQRGILGIFKFGETRKSLNGRPLPVEADLFRASSCSVSMQFTPLWSTLPLEKTSTDCF